MKKRHLLLSVFACLFFSHLSLSVLAQGSLTIYASEATVNEGENIEIDVKVVGFEDMINAQFSLMYDPQKLQYVSAGNFGFDNMNDDSFGTPGEGEIEEGELTFLWIADNIIEGESLPDSSTLFTLTFKGLESTDQLGSPIAFVNDPTPIEFGDVDGVVDDVTLLDGSIIVLGPDAVNEIITPAFVYYPITPNPIKEKALVRFELTDNSQTILSIYNLSGRVIYQSGTFSQRGENTIELSRDLFPAAGHYYVQLANENYTGVQPLIVID